MEEKIYIFGHKNPDTDSICSALVKERFNRKLGYEKCVARRLGNVNKETQYVLNYLGIEAPELLEKLEEDLKISNKVIHTGMVEQEELVDLYNLADLFVFPSLYEGFGIPILEALACGTPVICSNTSSLPEVGGDVVEYFNPLDVEEIKNTIERKLKDKNNINYEKQLKKFDWEKSVKETKELYRKL